MGAGRGFLLISGTPSCLCDSGQTTTGVTPGKQAISRVWQLPICRLPRPLCCLLCNVPPLRSEFPCFDDDLSGTASAVLAGILASLPKLGGKLGDQTYMFVGERLEQPNAGDPRLIA